MKKTIPTIIIAIGLLYSCDNGQTAKSDRETFADILNDPKVNSKEVGEREGIKFFQVIENNKYGFRDLDGKIVIAPQFDNAEMFSEGLSTVQVGDKFGLIDESGKYVLPLRQVEYLGSVHGGLLNFRANDKYGFINIKGQEIIKPQFDWVDEFSEGLCVVRNDNGKIGSGKNGYIDTTGKVVIDLQFDFADKFKNGRAKVQLGKVWQTIDKSGKAVAVDSASR